MESIHPFLRALELIGNTGMATALDVSPQMVSKMAKAAQADPYYQVPARHLRSIERATDRRVMVEELLIDRPAIEPQARAAA